MKLPFRTIEVAVILLGLTGIVLYWFRLDPMRYTLSASIAWMGIIQVVDFFRIARVQRSTQDKWKALLALAIVVAACFMPFARNGMPALALIALFLTQQMTQLKRKTRQEAP